MEPLLVEQDGPIRTLRLNRPEKRNALNDELTSLLLAALVAAGDDAGTRAIVLCGAGPSFCAGADVGEFTALREAPSEKARARADLTTALHAAFTEIAKPVVGAVRGHALGGGAGLALACDLLVLADTAVIGYPELQRGVVAAIVMANLVRQVGRKAAFELVSLGVPITAARARELGMTNRVVPEAEVEREAHRLAQALAQYDPAAMAATKRLFHRAADLPWRDALTAGRDANLAMRQFTPPGRD